ncbi:hypothetical protein K8T06_16235, partial [bacterium]|nr:hypothetical protein [bacterium]
MIEKMKIVSLVCLEKDKQMALESLRHLELMHVRPVSFQGSKKLAQVQKKLDTINRVINLLEGKNPSEKKPDKLSAEEIVEQVKSLNHKIIKNQEEWDQLTRFEEVLKPWGEFDPGLLESIKTNGLDIRMCVASADKIPELPDGSALTKINKIGDLIYFLVVSDNPIEIELKEVAIPSDKS